MEVRQLMVAPRTATATSKPIEKRGVHDCALTYVTLIEVGGAAADSGGRYPAKACIFLRAKLVVCDVLATRASDAGVGTARLRHHLTNDNARPKPGRVEAMRRLPAYSPPASCGGKTCDTRSEEQERARLRNSLEHEVGSDRDVIRNAEELARGRRGEGDRPISSNPIERRQGASRRGNDQRRLREIEERYFAAAPRDHLTVIHGSQSPLRCPG